MKKYPLIILAIIISCATFAQPNFTVPQLTDTQKLQTARRLGYNNILAAINFAKSQGMTAEEYGEYEGKLFEWDREQGFEGWINSFLFINAAFLAGNMEIINQSENKITVRMAKPYPEFESRGEMLGVSYKEFLMWYKVMFIQIFNYLDCTYSQVVKDDGFEITIEKR